MAASSSKPSGYAKRNNASTAVPLEPDSDSDFNPGVYLPDKPQKRGRKRRDVNKADTSDLSDSEPPHKKRRRDTLATIGLKSSRRSKEKRVVPVPQCPNLLVQYFGSLGIKAAQESEGEQEDADDEEEENEDKEDDTENDEEPLPMPRTLAILSNKSTPRPLPHAPDEDSVTEYESDLDDDAPFAKRSPAKRVAVQCPAAAKQSPSKRPRLCDPEESVTEPEDEEPHWIHAQATAAASLTSKVAEQSDSETEPESDPESFIETRPIFPLKLGQERLGPLSLDDNHQVPASINTFLREYQRDGVRFIWNRYNEGRGGLLGDDMGLVKPSR
ncbi:hypothetical protein OH77DRAFT_919140 [Trametes cingulata]|nr:hypothetical protein OH77DRAFT_919140 [Trametes cingulata]